MFDQGKNLRSNTGYLRIVVFQIQRRRSVSSGPPAHWTPSNPRSSIFEDFESSLDAASEFQKINALLDIGKACKRRRWIPLKLTENHKIQRMFNCQSILSMAMKANFFDSILTRDEKCSMTFEIPKSVL